jgi:hypothetical protein
MANVDAAFGAVPVGTTDGSDYHAKLRECVLLAADGTATFLGDFVKLSGTGSVDGKTPAVAQAAAGNAVIGAIVSFLPNFEDEGTLSSTPNHRAASTLRRCMVAWGSDVLYEIQADEDSSALATTDIGRNVDIVVATGSTITGISGMELDSSSVVDATAQLRLHGVANKVGNELGSTAAGDRAIWLVSINENQDDHGAGVS